MRRRIAAALALLAAGAAITSASTAAFVDQHAEAPATFEGGKLDLTATPVGTPLDASSLLPGQSRSAVLQLSNAGTVAATLTAGIRDLVDTPTDAALSAVLELRIDDCGAGEACDTPRSAYAGSLRDFSSTDLGEVAPGAKRFVRVTLAWDASKADPSRQGARTEAALVWTAVAGASK
jgi:hypothetical protein